VYRSTFRSSHVSEDRRNHDDDDDENFFLVSLVPLMSLPLRGRGYLVLWENEQSYNLMLPESSYELTCLHQTEPLRIVTTDTYRSLILKRAESIECALKRIKERSMLQTTSCISPGTIESYEEETKKLINILHNNRTSNINDYDLPYDAVLTENNQGVCVWTVPIKSYRVINFEKLCNLDIVAKLRCLLHIYKVVYLFNLTYNYLSILEPCLLRLG